MRLLIVEDDIDLAANLADWFEERGDEVRIARDGLAGLGSARATAFDAVLVDLGLPRLDGLELCRALRQELQPDAALVVITARDALDDKLEGFGAGADDYLVKPFALSELGARIDAALGRIRGRSGAPLPGARALTAGELSLDLDRREARRGGRPLALTPTGVRILEYLLRNRHRTVPGEELMEHLWGEEVGRGTTLRSHIRHLRRVLHGPGESPVLVTVPRFGYRLRWEADSGSPGAAPGALTSARRGGGSGT